MQLLVRLFCTDEGTTSTITRNRPFFFDAVGFVFRQSLSDFQASATSKVEEQKGEKSPDTLPCQCLSHTVAANLPPAIALMSRLVPISQLSSSTFTSILSQLGGPDQFVLMADGSLDEIQKEKKKLA